MSLSHYRDAKWAIEMVVLQNLPSNRHVLYGLPKAKESKLNATLGKAK